MMLSALNAAVARIGELPRVTFVDGLAEPARRWIAKKHENGALHEPATIAAMLVAKDRFDSRTIYDLGAHYGYFSLLARQMFPKAQLTAFDMHLGSIGVLHRNLGAWTQVVHAVVTDASRKMVEFWYSGFNIYEEPADGWDSLRNVPEAFKHRGHGFGRADFITLDDYCGIYKPPDLMKIDVEGFQTKAIAGAMRMIRAAKPVIIIELHDPEKLARFGTTNAETVRPLFEAGYRGYWCGNHRDMDARFEPVERMGPEHERLSLMVFAP